MKPEDAGPEFSLRALHRRTCVDTWIKASGTTIGMVLFFVLYFRIQELDGAAAFMVPETWPDRLIGLLPWTIVPYFSLWFYISLPLAFMIERRQMIGFAAGCGVLATIGLGIFALWPTAVSAPDGVEWSRHPGFSLLKTTDINGNACPSLHAAFAVFAALWLARQLREFGAGRWLRWANIAWAGLIVFSTMGTKQHVAIDALCGVALGAWVGLFNLALVSPEPMTRSISDPLLIAIAAMKVSAILLWTTGLPAGVCGMLFFMGGSLMLLNIFSPYAGELTRVRNRFRPSARHAREVWITLDDGPDPADTPRVLELLEQHGAKATFFLIGERAARHPELVALIAKKGHEIGNHTHTHPISSFWIASRAKNERELNDCDAAIRTAVPDARIRLFRGPVGFKNWFLARALEIRGLQFLGWSIRSNDTMARDPAAVVRHVRAALKPGAIILLHEGPPLRPAVRVAAIAGVLAALREEGYRTVIPENDRLY